MNAHTQLVNSDPKDGVVIQEWPGQVLLTFDENLQTIKNQKLNYVVVNNAQGDQVSADDESLRKISYGSHFFQIPCKVRF